MTKAHRWDPRQRSLLRAFRRPFRHATKRRAPAHASSHSPARALLWWVGGFGALVLLGSWIGAASMSTSGHDQRADPPRAIDSTTAVPGVTAGPTPAPTGSVEAAGSDSADCDPTRTACDGGATTAAGTGAAPRSPRPVRSVSPPNDPKYGSCAEAKAHGYGPYVRGEGPEYAWYRQEDTDNDGVVCG